MKFYIDESGTFSIPQGMIQHSACVVVCVVVSEYKLDQLNKKFLKYCSNLPKDQLDNGEPKGSKLNNSQRLEFCNILSGFKDSIMVVPITIDMTLLAMFNSEKTMTQKFSNRLMNLRQYMLHDSMKEEIELLAKQFMNLSFEDCLKIICYAHALYVSMRYSILGLSAGNNENSWNSIEIEIDRSNKKLDSREKKIFTKMLGMWFEAWSKKSPFTLRKEVHTSKHPFVINYDSENGIVGGKLINNNVNWVNSKDSWGIRISDIASNIIFKAVNDLENRNNTFKPFCELMHLSPYGYQDGPGLFTIVNLEDEAKKLFRIKYKKLGEEMIANNFQSNYYAEILKRLDDEIELYKNS